MAVDVTLSVPQDMMQLARKVAVDAKVSVEAVLLDWLHHPVTKPTLSDVDSQLGRLSYMTDIQLWTVVNRHLETAQQQRLDEIVEKHETGHTLSDSEKQAWSELTKWVEILMLLRSQSLIHLKERDYDVSRFFKPQHKYD